MLLLLACTPDDKPAQEPWGRDGATLEVIGVDPADVSVALDGGVLPGEVGEGVDRVVLRLRWSLDGDDPPVWWR